MWTIVKAMDEGTSEPFIARLMVGILELRDNFIQSRMSSQAELEPMRKEFDDLYGPVLDALFAMRKSASSIRELLKAQQRKLISGEIVGWQRNALEIHESINSQLQEDFSKFLNSAVRAVKLLQAAASHIGVSIRGIFAKPHNYERQMLELEAAGHPQLAAYLRSSRTGWSERLVARRNALEHDGWSLGSVQYSPMPDRTVHMREPTIDSENVSEWVTSQTAHVLAFVEDVMVYAFQKALPPEVIIVEIPATERDRTQPCRFRLGFPRFEAVGPWTLQYNATGFR